jgi:hypothetical protein
MDRLNRTRALIAAFLPLITIGLLGTSVLNDDWYSGDVIIGDRNDPESDWWWGMVDCRFSGVLVQSGDNNNLFNLEDWNSTEVAHTDEGESLFSGLVLSFIGACGLIVVLFIMGILVRQRKLSWYLPFIVSLISVALIAVPAFLLHDALPDILESDMGSASKFTEENMPENGAEMLLDNSTYGSSFDYVYYSLIPLMISPLLLIGIKRRPLPSLMKVAGDFYSPEKDRDFEVYEAEDEPV